MNNCTLLIADFCGKSKPVPYGGVIVIIVDSAVLLRPDVVIRPYGLCVNPVTAGNIFSNNYINGIFFAPVYYLHLL